MTLLHLVLLPRDTLFELLQQVLRGLQHLAWRSGDRRVLRSDPRILCRMAAGVRAQHRRAALAGDGSGAREPGEERFPRWHLMELGRPAHPGGRAGTRDGTRQPERSRLGTRLRSACRWRSLPCHGGPRHQGRPAVGPHLGLLGVYLRGYEVTWPGAVIGLLYGFVLGYLAGWSVSVVYNRLARRDDLVSRRFRPLPTELLARP